MRIKLAERNPLRMKAEAYLAPPTHASLRMLRAPGAVAVNPQKSAMLPDKPRILAVNNESTPLLARAATACCRPPTTSFTKPSIQAATACADGRRPDQRSINIQGISQSLTGTGVVAPCGKPRI
ncbi:MAG: hypothetical protein LT080_10545 [Thiobacillus sp.]|nr:hypothetical protein [Thiobacillus sp.]